MRTVLTLLGMALVFSMGACSGGDDNTVTEIKAAWVYIGPPGDHGWTYAHDQGRKAAEANLPKVITSYEENVPENDAATTIQALADAGNHIIFTTSFGYGEPTHSVALANPEVKFDHCSSNLTAANMGNYFGRMYQIRYLTGMVAGAMTQSGKIGYVAAFDIPEVIYMINAFTLGVRSVNPQATVEVRWTKTWYDPTVEGAKANELLAAGCDVMSQHQDSTATVFAARDAGKYAIGYHSDMLSFAPNTVLTSAVWNWAPYYQAEIQAVRDKTWTSRSYLGGIPDGVVDLGAYGSMVPQTVKDSVAAKKAEITSGSWDVFYGPFNHQDGTPWVAAGDKLSDEQILSMMEFVEGVIGTIPAP